MIATVANMRKVQDQSGVFVWSLSTGEEYSADPGDYWNAAEDYTLKDEIGEPMILVRRVIREVEEP